MKPAKAERPVTTPFGKKGSSWATGEHGGIDYGCPTGDPVYAMWDGTVTSKSWGSAYGTHLVIDHDHLPDGDPGLWAVYAHLSSKSVSAGAKVKAGQQIGKSGATGNVTGPHLHVEVQRDSSWQQGNYVDPQPWVDAVKPGDVYLSKLVYGQEDSDSVRRLQQALNDHSLQPPGDQMLPVTGNYAEMTDEVVRADQQQHGFGSDPVKASSVGPQQAEHLFAGTGNTVINDLPDGTAPPEAENIVPVVSEKYGTWEWYSGKDTDDWTVYPNETWTDIPGFVQPASNIKSGDPHEEHFLYLRVRLPEGRSAERILQVRFIRSDGDETAYDYRAMGLTLDSYPFGTIHTENGSGLGGRWQVWLTGGTDPIKIGTRYAKTFIRYHA